MKGVNVRLLRKTIADKGGKAIAIKITDVIEKELEKKTDKFLQNFDNHPVTQEIQAGPGSGSKFLPSSKGSLFGLLGFQAGKNPIGALREMLKNGIKMQKNRIGTKTTENGRILIEVPVSIISLGEIYTKTQNDSDTKISWTGRSFVDQIQKGIEGFGSYLSGMFKISKSGDGIQAKNQDGSPAEVRNIEMRPIKYLDELLEKFKQSLRSNK
jgi:hypothetical protein